jgi:hypothetical protein
MPNIQNRTLFLKWRIRMKRTAFDNQSGTLFIIIIDNYQDVLNPVKHLQHYILCNCLR